MLDDNDTWDVNGNSAEKFLDILVVVYKGQ